MSKKKAVALAAVNPANGKVVRYSVLAVMLFAAISFSLTCSIVEDHSSFSFTPAALFTWEMPTQIDSAAPYAAPQELADF